VWRWGAARRRRVGGECGRDGGELRRRRGDPAAPVPTGRRWIQSGTMTPEEFRVAAHALVDWIADHRARVAELPVAADVKPGEVAAALPAHAPEAPEPFEAVLADLERVVVPGIVQP